MGDRSQRRWRLSAGVALALTLSGLLHAPATVAAAPAIAGCPIAATAVDADALGPRRRAGSAAVEPADLVGADRAVAVENGIVTDRPTPAWHAGLLGTGALLLGVAGLAVALAARRHRSPR